MARSSLELCLDAVEGLPDPLVCRLVDPPRAHAGDHPRDGDVGGPVHGGRAVGAVGQHDPRGGVHGAPGRVAARLHRRVVRLVDLRELDVDHDLRAEEARADLAVRLEPTTVELLDRLDARRAACDLVRIHDERPDLRAGGVDLDPALELHAAVPRYEWSGQRHLARRVLREASAVARTAERVRVALMVSDVAHVCRLHAHPAARAARSAGVSTSGFAPGTATRTGWSGWRFPVRTPTPTRRPTLPPWPRGERGACRRAPHRRP